MRFEIHRSTKQPGKFWWRGVGDNNEVMCSSQLLSSKQACVHTIRVVKAEAAHAPVYDKTGPTTVRLAA